MSEGTFWWTPDRAASGALRSSFLTNSSRRQHGALRRDIRASLFRRSRGRRFGCGNSGAIAVVEESADHGCEYMTGYGRRAWPHRQNFGAE